MSTVPVRMWVWTDDGRVYETDAFDRTVYSPRSWFCPQAGGTLTYGVHLFSTRRQAINAALDFFYTEQLKLEDTMASLRSMLAETQGGGGP